jgi:signal transduction histidine kinase
LPFSLRRTLIYKTAGRGLRFDWQVKDVPTIGGFGPEMALQILRIVQEAFANVLKHARATTITVRSGETNGAAPPGVFLDISDDGRGIGPGTGGRGLDNMRWRARSIGGTLDVTSAGGQGTSVHLWLPLRPAASPPLSDPHR